MGKTTEVDWAERWPRYLKGGERRQRVMRGLPPPRLWAPAFGAYLVERWDGLDHPALTRKRYGMIYGKDSELRILRGFLGGHSPYRERLERAHRCRLPREEAARRNYLSLARVYRRLERFFVTTGERELLYNDLDLLARKVPAVEAVVVQLLAREKDRKAHAYALERIRPKAFADNTEHPLALHVLKVVGRRDGGGPELRELYARIADELSTMAFRCDRCRRPVARGDGYEGYCESCYGELWDRGFSSSVDWSDEQMAKDD